MATSYLFADLIDTYLREMPAAARTMASALRTQDWPDVYKIVHKIKPSFMMFGMQAQEEKSKEIESMIMSGKPDEGTLSEWTEWIIASVEASIPLLEQEREQLK